MKNSQSIIIAPSILAADLGNLEAEIKDVEKSGADWLHIDVMDGHFVPPITFGDNVVRIAKASSRLFLDVHLMVNNPERHFEAFKAAGADRLIVHQETCPHLYRTLTAIRSMGIANGVSVNPGTAIESIFPVLEVSDLVLVMTVNPGWGGQPFIESSCEKIKILKEEISRRNLSTLVEVDGGINETTARQCVAAGATVLVAGSSIFNNKDRKSAIAKLRG